MFCLCSPCAASYLCVNVFLDGRACFFFKFKLNALSVFKSNECSEDSYIGLGDFFCLFVFRKKSENLFKLNFNFSRFDL